MNPIRKRVGRVGSGAFSLYLPKKWMDTWSPEQWDEREVDLIPLARGLLILPVIRQETYTATLNGEDPRLADQLRSAFVRGYRNLHVTLEPKGTSQTLEHARSLLRHLDQGLQIKMDPSSIIVRSVSEETLAQAVPLSEHVHGMAQSLLRCVHAHGSDFDMVEQGVHYARAVYREDIARGLDRILRAVNRLQVHLRAVADLQELTLEAVMLERVARRMDETAGLLQHNLAAGEETWQLRGLALDLRLVLRDMVADLVQFLQVQQNAGDAEAYDALGEQMGIQFKAHQAKVLDLLTQHWGETLTPDDATQAFRVYGWISPIQHAMEDMLGSLETLATLARAR